MYTTGILYWLHVYHWHTILVTCIQLAYYIGYYHLIGD